MTVTPTDLELIQHLEFTPEELCDNWDWTGCQKTATWRARQTCCDDTFVVCDPCKDATIKFLITPEGVTNTCKSCGASGLTYPTCIEFTRIKP